MAKTNMAPLRGWGPRGHRLIAKARHGRWQTLTFLAALRHNRIDAPCVIDGPINGDRFIAYVEQLLIPTLAPGDIVVMDNLGSHKRQAVRSAIRAAGAKLFFLPPYSPDLNPLSRSSPSSKRSCAKLRSAPSKPPGNELAHSSASSRQPNVPTTSEIQAMLQSDRNRL